MPKTLRVKRLKAEVAVLKLEKKLLEAKIILAQARINELKKAGGRK